MSERISLLRPFFQVLDMNYVPTEGAIAEIESYIPDLKDELASLSSRVLEAKGPLVERLDERGGCLVRYTDTKLSATLLSDFPTKSCKYNDIRTLPTCRPSPGDWWRGGPPY